MKNLLLLISLLTTSVAFAHQPKKTFDFKENKGQWPEQVLYRTQMGSATLFLEGSAMTWTLVHPEDLALVHGSSEWSQEELLAWEMRGHAYKVHFVDGAAGNVVGQETQAGYYNFFIGQDTDKWASNVQAFGAVRYGDIWENIGMRVYNSNDLLKYDFLVSPGADVSQVKLQYEGVTPALQEDGSILLVTSVGDVIEQAPFAYQMDGTDLMEVACEYVLEGGQLHFAFPEGYDEAKQLVIDPIVIASTLSGTSGSQNYGHSAAYDIAGNIYTGARSFGAGYPTTTGAFQENFSGGGFGVDIAVSKLNPTGSDLIWASYIGGSGSDYPHSMITNDFEELYVYGSSNSEDYPVTADAFDSTLGGTNDIVITHFNDDGTALIGSTYMGGSDIDGQNSVSVNYGDTFRGEIILDNEFRPFIASFSSSTDFPVSGGAYQPNNAGGQDAVIFGMNEELSSLIWSTYLGGEQGDTGYGIRVNSNSEVYVCGTAGSADFPTTGGAYQSEFLGGGGGWNNQEKDGYVARFSPDGEDLQYCTFLGTTEEDQCFFLDLDNAEDVFVYGQSGGEMPITEDVYSEENGSLFITKFNAILTEVLASSMVAPGGGFGGYGGVPIAFLVDRCDNIYVSAHGASNGLTTTDDAVYTNGGFYLAAYGENITTQEFATYYEENHVDGGTSRFDKSGIVYQGVCSGGGFPTNPDAWSDDQPSWDIGVFKMDFQVSGVNAAITASADALTGCAPHEIEFSNFSVGNIFTWDFGDGSPESNEFEPTHLYTDPGVYEVSLISLDSLSCNLADTAYLEVLISIPTDFQAAFDVALDCEDLSVSTENLTGVDFLEYEWDMGDGTVLDGFEVNHTYADEGDYTITLSAIDNGCNADDEAEQVVTVVGSVQASADGSAFEGCGELELTFDNTSNGITYLWDFGDGSPTSLEENPTHTFSPGTYEVTLTAFHPESCNLEDDTTLTVVVGEEQIIDAAFQLVQTDCEAFLVEGTNSSNGDNLAFEWDMGDGTSFQTADITHNYDMMGSYTVVLTATDTLCDAIDIASLDITVLDEVTAIIGNADQTGCDPFIATFENNSAGTNFYWDFGDGSPVFEGQLAEHEYAEPGDYTVTLTVEGVGNCGGEDITTASVTVVETPEIAALFEMEQSGACEAMLVDFDNTSIGEDLTYEWSLDGITYSVAEFDHTFSGPGVYDITLEITEPVCDASDTFTASIEVLEGIDLAAPADQYLCYYETSTQIEVVGPADAAYEWDNGTTGTSTSVTAPGIYTLTATLNNCTDAVGVEIIGVEELALIDTPVACEGVQARLQIPYDNGNSYLWCDGSELDFIYADQPGEYCYQFRDEFGCTQEGLIVLTQIDQDGRIFVPNAFTPNNDGVNDVFKAEGEGIEDFKMSVWNRWGEEVFRTTDITEFWNGNYDGGQYYVQDEVYTWKVEFNSSCSAEKVVKSGTVLMMR